MLLYQQAHSPLITGYIQNVTTFCLIFWLQFTSRTSYTGGPPQSRLLLESTAGLVKLLTHSTQCVHTRLHTNPNPDACTKPIQQTDGSQLESRSFPLPEILNICGHPFSMWNLCKANSLIDGWVGWMRAPDNKATSRLRL